MILRRWMPQYDPHAQFQWFDIADKSRIKAPGGVAITDGADVESITSGGTSSAKFVQAGANPLPTWHATGPLGVPGLRFDGAGQALRLDSVSGYTSLSGLTVSIVASMDNADRQQDMFTITNGSNSQSRGLSIGRPGDSTLYAGGRRLDSDGYQEFAFGPRAPGQPFILTASYDYANGRFRGYRDGVLMVDAPFQTPGQSASSAPGLVIMGKFNLTSPAANSLMGWIYAVGVERSAPSPDATVPHLHYLRIAKGIG